MTKQVIQSQGVSPSPGELRVVDVFIAGPGGGNPVPLVADAIGMSEEQMRDVARGSGYESGFVLPATDPAAQWRLRFFVPHHEMEMCGHATVGAMWALRQWGIWRTDTARVQTLSGLVDVLWDEPAQRVWVSQPDVRLESLLPEECQRVSAVLGGALDLFSPTMVNATTSRAKTLVQLPDVAALHALEPDFPAMESLCAAIESTGLYPYALVRAGAENEPVVVARQFPKASGYPEDAATGIAAAALWGYLADRGTIPIGRAETPVVCTVRQGEAMGRPSAIEVRARFAADGSVAGCWISGHVSWGHSAASTAEFDTPEKRLASAGYSLPDLPQPRGRYAPYHRTSLAPKKDLVSISGQTSRVGDVPLVGICKPGDALEPAQAAARVAMLRAIAALVAACGGHLPPEIQLLRLRGYIRSTAEFGKHSAVLDAASDILQIAWPNAALPARTAVGVSSLPDGVYIEIELDALVGHKDEL